MIELFAVRQTVGASCWMGHPGPARERAEAASSFPCPSLRAAVASSSASACACPGTAHGRAA
eukprot:616882-Pyramimonas_sp.AAC.1